METVVKPSEHPLRAALQTLTGLPEVYTSERAIEAINEAIEQYDTMSRSDKLRLAARLVSEVRTTLQTKNYKCEVCGLKHYHDKHEWKLDQHLEGAITRISKTGVELERMDHGRPEVVLESEDAKAYDPQH